MPKKSNKSWNNRGGGGGRPNNPSHKPFFGNLSNDPARRRNPDSDDPFINRRPRVSFKTPRPIRDVTRNFQLSSLDDDISMTIGSSNNARQGMFRGKNRGFMRGRNSPLPHRGQRAVSPLRNLRTFLNKANWYKVCIPFGHKYEKDYVLNNLLSYMAPITFLPIMYKVIGNEAVFYVDDYKTASKLLECDRKITTIDGHKLQVKIKPGLPDCTLDETLKERLKLAMSKRYVAETNALDLSKFHQDPDLIADYFCALVRPMMLMAVLDIVAEHIPHLEALNLDGNKLTVIERLSVLHSKFPKLKILYVGDNKIREMNQIDSLKDLKLEELRLAGNPVCSKYKTRENEYVSDVRKRFPKLLRLDGIELPRPILFDVADEGVKLPEMQKMFISNPKAYEVASRFLQQYISIYDSDNRQPLLDAYHENACFSMTVYYGSNIQKFNKYASENRNLFRFIDSNKRRKLLKQGRLPVVSFISELPRTQHYLNTFTMDLNVVAQDMMFIVVTGMFKELGSKEEPLRYFNRTFVIIPEGSGYCICNEQLHIAQPSELQEKQLQNIEINEIQPQAGTSTSSMPSTSMQEPIMAQPVLSEEMKQQMTLTLSQQTNMNLEWSLKCLEEVQWNYDSAYSIFQEFFKRGQIPSEAFNK